MKLKGPYFCCLILLIITTINLGDASRILSHPNNTSIIKTIKSEDGDVIDCVDISRQPAFDHPLLKDHTIKMTPSSHPEGLSGSNGNKKQITQLWQRRGDCPEGTIPIRRTEEQERLIRKKPRRFQNPKLPSSFAEEAAVDPLKHEYAITYTTGQGDYYGAKATINAWNPIVEDGREFSLSQLWILGGSPRQHLNTIEVGWTVDPAVFNDYRTRLFVYWTRNNYQSTGCWNLGCSGFVQISNRVAIGGAIATNQEITLLVWKDAGTNAWWLQYNGVDVGYWPTSIFTALKGSASQVEWGGEIINSRPNGRHTATEMGSGRFAEAGSGSANYFRNLKVVNNANTLLDLPSIGSYASNPQCYTVVAGKTNDGENFFYYGGPGRNANCP